MSAISLKIKTIFFSIFGAITTIDNVNREENEATDNCAFPI